MHKLKFYKLKNNINLIHVYIPDFPVALSSFWVKAGSKIDPKGKEGLAHFFEHLLTTTTTKFPDRQKRLIEIEKQGFLFNAFTSLATSNYYITHSPEDIERALNLLIDGFSSSIFREKDINEEKQIIIDEERRNRNDPISYIWRLANSGLWPHSQIGSGFFGNQNTINIISRNDILNFYNMYYRSQNATFLLINSLKKVEDQIKEIEKIQTLNLKPITDKNNLSGKKDIIFEKRELNYSQISLSFLTTSGHNEKDHLILDLIRNYLASGWMSRLITRLRVQDKLTYWVSSHSDRFDDTGFIRFTTSLDKGKIGIVLKIFEEEIISLKNKPIQNKILNQHKNKYKNDILRSTLDINYLNWWYGSNFTAFDKKPLVVNEYIKKMLKISPEQIQEISNKYFQKKNFSLAIIGAEQEIKDIPNFQ